MTNIESLLSSRLSKGPQKKDPALQEPSSKARSLAERSNSGQLSGYSQLLGSVSISQHEKELLKDLLDRHKNESHGGDLDSDLHSLSLLTQEIRSITLQSILLHGERIHRAQKLLSSYTNGAFSAWLLTIYGNRQTPYNFLLYYQLYSSIDRLLQEKLDAMPKQIAYALASKQAPIQEKASFIQQHHGKVKSLLAAELRQRFPLAEKDGRKKALSFTAQLQQDLEAIVQAISSHSQNAGQNVRIEERRRLISTAERLLSLIQQL